MSGPLVDYTRSACLCEAGLPDYFAAACVTADGEDTLWLVRRSVLGADDAPHGDADQSHEGLGRLPAHVRERIWGEALRCGRPRLNGLPCRQRVAEPGRVCGVHADRPVRS